MDSSSHLIELEHGKTNKMTCVHSKDSDPPGHPPKLIVFPVCLKKVWVPSYPENPQEQERLLLD